MFEIFNRGNALIYLLVYLKKTWQAGHGKGNSIYTVIKDETF